MFQYFFLRVLVLPDIGSYKLLFPLNYRLISVKITMLYIILSLNLIKLSREIQEYYYVYNII